MGRKPVELSDDAWAVRTGMFFSPGTFTLTMQNIERRLSPRAQAAVDELEAKGMMNVERHGKTVIYCLTARGQDLPRKSFDWMGKHGKFAVTEAIK